MYGAKNLGSNQAKAVTESNPDAFPNRLDQAITGIGASLYKAKQIRDSLFGSCPEEVSGNESIDQSISERFNRLQSRITELDDLLQGILKYF